MNYHMRARHLRKVATKSVRAPESRSSRHVLSVHRNPLCRVPRRDCRAHRRRGLARRSSSSTGRSPPRALVGGDSLDHAALILLISNGPAPLAESPKMPERHGALTQHGERPAHVDPRWLARPLPQLSLASFPIFVGPDGAVLTRLPPQVLPQQRRRRGGPAAGHRLFGGHPSAP